MERHTALLALAVIGGYWAVRGVVLRYIPLSASSELTETWEREALEAGEKAALESYGAGRKAWPDMAAIPKGWPWPRLEGQALNPQQLLEVFIQLRAHEAREGKGRWEKLIRQLRTSIPRMAQQHPELGGPYRVWVDAAHPVYQARWVDWYSQQYFAWDVAMTLPRLAAFCLCLMVAACSMRPGWAWESRHAPHSAFAWLLAAAAGLGTVATALGTHLHLTAMQRVSMIATTVPVALFEECGFRGLLFLSLAGRMRPWLAGLLSSVLFAVWHYPTHGVLSLPHIFFFGLACCGALHQGVGLTWLVLAHFLVDAWAVALGGAAPSPAVGWAGYALLIVSAVLPWVKVRSSI